MKNLINNTNVNELNQTRYYTVYSYRVARSLLKQGCTIADLGINTKMKGIVFHFINEPKLRKVIKLQEQVAKLQNQIDEIDIDEVAEKLNSH